MLLLALESSETGEYTSYMPAQDKCFFIHKTAAIGRPWLAHNKYDLCPLFVSLSSLSVFIEVPQTY